jgi:hypothetical protein
MYVEKINLWSFIIGQSIYCKKQEILHSVQDDKEITGYGWKVKYKAMCDSLCLKNFKIIITSHS